MNLVKISVICFFIYFLLVCLVGCSTQKKSNQFPRYVELFENEYPEWFLFPKRFPDHVTGYGIDDIPPVIDAERRYCVYNDCILKGIHYRYQDYDSTYRDYYYYFSSDSLFAIHNKLHLLDKFCTNVATKEFIGIFSLEKDKFIDSSYINITDIPKPDWVESGKQCWKSDDYWFGVGEYTFKGNENDAWKTAEEEAVYNIAAYIAIGVHAININQEISNNSELDNSEKITAFRFDHKISNVMISERWLDLKNNMVYVLAKIKCDNIKAYLK